MVCMTLVKVAVCSRGNPEMGGELTETPAIRPIGPLMRGAYQRHIRMSAVYHDSPEAHSGFGDTFT